MISVREEVNKCHNFVCKCKCKCKCILPHPEVTRLLISGLLTVIRYSIKNGNRNNGIRIN